MNSELFEKLVFCMYLHINIDVLFLIISFCRILIEI